jgi:hypothetical protein
VVRYPARGNPRYGLGEAGAEARARSARDRLRPILKDLAGLTQELRATFLRRPARAAAYLLTVTAQPG